MKPNCYDYNCTNSMLKELFYIRFGGVAGQFITTTYYASYHFHKNATVSTGREVRLHGNSANGRQLALSQFVLHYCAPQSIVENCQSRQFI